MSSGNEVEQDSFDGVNTQKWVFTHVGNDEYTIRSAQNTTYYLGVKNNSTAEEAAIVLRTGTVTGSMRWKIEEGVQGYLNKRRESI